MTQTSRLGMRALDLVVGMVNADNLTAIVGRLMRQLRNAPIATAANDAEQRPSSDDRDRPLRGRG